MPAHVAYPGVPIPIPERRCYGMVTVALWVQVCVGGAPLLDSPVAAMSMAFACPAPGASAWWAGHGEAKGVALPAPHCRSRSVGGAWGGEVAGRGGFPRSIDWTFSYVLQQWHQWPTLAWTEDAL